MMNILFICTGNTCRSVMAEYYIKDRLQELEILGITACSAGVTTIDGMPASQGTLADLEEVNIDASKHRSRVLTREIAETADEIYALAYGHMMTVNNMFPSVKDKVRLLAKKSIPDPIGLSLEEYKDCFDLISKAVETGIIYKINKSGRGKE